MSGAADPVVRTERLTIGYGGARPRVVATSLDLSLRQGRLVCVLGPNGSGKTTLLRTLAGLLPAIEGEVKYRGRPVGEMSGGELAKQRSIVLTQRAGAAMLRARELVSLGRLPYSDWLGRMAEADTTAVDRAMETTGCAELADRRLSELSDGERQRAFIARAMAQETPVMLLDEPTAFLDLPRRVEIVRLLVRLAHDCRRAVALSTHDLDLALQTADEVWLLTNSGRVLAGTPEELVLDGSFGEVFATEGVRFDPRLGRFVWKSADGPRVRVVGEGIEAVWTKHSLRRVGFHVVEAGEAADRIVEVGVGGGWQVVEAGVVKEYPTLSEMLEGLKEGRTVE